MGPVPRTLEFFYDVLSPYSWLGFEVLCRYQHLWNIKLQLRPCLISGIMKDSGNKAPALVPRKAQYMARDLRLLRQHFQVPIHTPKDFFVSVLGKGSLSAMRFLTTVNMEQPEMLEKVSRELWMRLWSRDEDITEPQSILAVGKGLGRKTYSCREGKGQVSADHPLHKTDKALSPDIFPACRKGRFSCRASSRPSGKDLHSTGEEPAQRDHRGSLQTRGLWVACHCGPCGWPNPHVIWL